MPRKPQPQEDPNADFDALLESGTAEPAVVLEQGTINDIPVGEPVAVAKGTINDVPAGDLVVGSDLDVSAAASVLTPAQRRLQEAREAMRALQQAPAPQVVTEAVPEEDPYEGLSEDEIRELKAAEDFVAAETAKRLVEAPIQYDNSQRGGTGDKILFHIVQDGFTVFGDVWLRGQEIEIEVGTPAWKRTQDIFGNSWVDLRDDIQGQYDRWGVQYIAAGPFIARPNEKFEDEVATADRRRGRSVPITIV